MSSLNCISPQLMSRSRSKEMTQSTRPSNLLGTLIGTIALVLEFNLKQLSRWIFHLFKSFSMCKSIYSSTSLDLTIDSSGPQLVKKSSNASSKGSLEIKFPFCSGVLIFPSTSSTYSQSKSGEGLG